MTSNWHKILNILTFGYLNRKAKKIAKNSSKNQELVLNTLNIPDIDVLINDLGGEANILEVSSTISTISFHLKNLDIVKRDQLEKILKGGVMKSADNITLIVGDCANGIEKEILNRIKK